MPQRPPVNLNASRLAGRESDSADFWARAHRGLRDGGWMGEGRPQGGHALAILPGLTHDNIFSSPLFAAVTLAFLGEQAS
jgi:hypothetical protein